MKNKKKIKNIIEFIVVCSFVVLSVPFANYIIEKGDIVGLNNQMNIENVDLLTPVEENHQSDNRSYIEFNSNGSRSFEKRDGSTKFTYSGYPDVVDDYHLTYIKVTSGPWHVYGVTVGDPIGKSNELDAKHHYTKEVIGSRYIYSNGKISVVFKKNYEGKIDSFEIFIETTNKDQVSF